jgi:hypothetical protein
MDLCAHCRRPSEPRVCASCHVPREHPAGVVFAWTAEARGERRVVRMPTRPETRKEQAG